MLQTLRDKAQGWTAWVIIGLIGITFVLFGTESLFNASSRDGDVIAKVDGVKITSYQLENAYKRYLHQPDAEASHHLDPNLVKKELLQALIEEAVLFNAMKHLGLEVNDSRISNIISTVPAFMEDGHFSKNAYLRYLVATGFKDPEFRVLVRESVLKQQFQLGLVQTAFSLSPDIDTLIKFNLQKRDIRYLDISAASFGKEVSLTPEELQQYYDNHLKDFLTDEQISLEYILLSFKDLKNQQVVQEDDIQKYYAENKSSFGEPERVHVEHILISVPKDADNVTIQNAQKKIQEIQKKLKAGESFESLAKAYSDDDASKLSGGDLNWIEKGELVPEFEKSAFALEKTGQISEPVRTEFGFHLIKLVAKQKEKIRPMDEIKEEMVSKLKNHLAEEQFINQADELATLVFDHPDSLQAAAEKLSLKVQKTKLFTQQQGPEISMLQHPVAITAAFSPSVKEDKNNSDLLKLDDENYVVLRVAEHKLPTQKPFEAVKSDIEKKLLFEKSSAMAKARANEILKNIKDPKITDEKINAEYPWQTRNDLSRASTDVPAEIVENAFTLPRGRNSRGSADITALPHGDFAIVWLTNVSDGNLSNLTQAEKDNYRDALNRHLGELEFQLFAKDLMKKARIKKYSEKIS